MSAGLQAYGVNYSSPRYSDAPPLTGLDALAAGSHYAQQQQHQQQSSHSGVTPVDRQSDMSVRTPESDGYSKEQDKTRGQAGAPHPKTKSASGPVRRRISRACDQCNQLRTKCDGQFPCAHCKEYGLNCEYARERKKRGKASRKEIAAQEQAQNEAPAPSSNTQVAGTSPRSPKSGTDNQSAAAPAPSSPPARTGAKRRRVSIGQEFPQENISSTHGQQQQGNAAFALPPPPSAINPPVQPLIPLPVNQLTQLQPTMHQYAHAPTLSASNMHSHNMSASRAPFGPPGDFSTMNDYHRNILQHPTNVNGQNTLHNPSAYPPNSSQLPQLPTNPYVAPSPPSQNGGSLGQLRFSESPASGPGGIGQSPHGNSPAWLDLPSPSASLYANLQQSQSQQSLRYPVLRPILPRISSIIPISLACDLLDIYFASSSSAFMQPASPYILGFVLRKKSVLRKTDPRPCSRALLASMLWVGAQTSESSYLTSPPSQRGKVCHQLLELTLSLFKPLVHTSANDLGDGNSSRIATNGVAIGGFGIANPAAGHDTEGGSTGATAALDDVVTYINLATVVSASEYKAASLRWWNAAWSLARELKLGRELPPNISRSPQHSGADVNGDNVDMRHNSHPNHHHPNMPRPDTVSEEEREERRRIWWLLYIVDRHLALCYNRPLFLLDAECEGLLHPEDDSVWQAQEYYSPPQFEHNLFRRIGPSFECTGHSMFGYFLPLMCILGEIVDIKHAKHHPRFGLRFRGAHEWQDQVSEVNRQLKAYGRSLKDFEDRFTTTKPSALKPSTVTPGDPAAFAAGPDQGATASSILQHNATSTTSAPRMTEAVLQTRIVVAYGTHLMNTLHILVNAKWDPLELLDDEDQWISNSGSSFVAATGHAVAAADAITDILEYDPDLSFMPFFFGIYLLQGSFLLLLIADKLQGRASPSVVRACEAIVRAHEVCVVTLNTEYQRNFRKVMRSALAQVKGRTPEDFGEQQQRRREVLALYRWTGDGTGLAL